MKHSITAIALLATAALSTSSCRRIVGDGPSITKTYSLSGFSSINSGIDGDVYYTQDSTYHVEIYGQSNILDKIETPIENGELRLQFRKFERIGWHNKVIVRISAPAMTGLGVNGSGNLYANQPVNSANMNVKVNGSGNVTMSSYTGSDFTSQISGSGRITVNGGKVQTASTRISGSGDVDIAGMQAENATVNTSGSGNVRIWATNTLDVRISGSGDVYYSGNPVVTTSISGSGKVRHN
ncbi:MAG: DUF2807 domain-containing protein [Taibaiella sp.]|nr:DUF2807 domain-containing protein [Taibaiella sp.]